MKNYITEQTLHKREKKKKKKKKKKKERLQHLERERTQRKAPFPKIALLGLD